MSKTFFSKRTLLCLAAYGFLLNVIWEFAQAGPLYEIWDEVTLAAGLFHITLAIIGDVLMVLLISVLTGWICGFNKLRSLSPAAGGCMITVGFVSGLILEWSAKFMDWWTYSELMPTITLIEETVGVSPVMQMTLLPFFSMLLTVKSSSYLLNVPEYQ